ncbi:hypothetical protein [Paenibacillus oryzisoli]|uniref:Uncharacterized protein n=1 Tax=Paenibacillus oryzisoli TaxID=1850517 RepID=A0A197ZXM6_9BACL|nr:hypothetical protein [Paenibacillus oryzisoli]OAS13735.1 hypothetical protein A8708_25170 [Paenibacillus oryzisoli]
MKDLFSWIKTVRKELKLILYFTVISIFLLDFWLFDVPEWFPYANKLANLWYKVCLAYITSFIFFYINVHIHSERLKSKVMIYVNNKIVPIYSNNLNLLTELSITLPNKFTVDNFKNALQQINPHNTAELYYHGKRVIFENWFEALEHFYLINKELIHDTLLFKESINSDVLGLLSRIENNLMNHVNVFKGQISGNPDLEIISSGLYNHTILCNKLLLTFREKHAEHIKAQTAIYKSEKNSEVI